MNLDMIRERMMSAFLEGNKHTPVPRDGYTDFAYPKVLKLMRFHTERYWVDGYGHFMTMHTRTVFGMELLTASFMPGEGVGVPYCLIDIMCVGKKRTVFVEYYDCIMQKPDRPRLERVRGRYDDLSEYREKPKWYVGERMPYSLIKCGGESDERLLEEMILASIDAYKAEISCAETDPANIAGLKAFRERMINEGNPSSSVLEKVFGKEGAKEFFTRCVMPV